MAPHSAPCPKCGKEYAINKSLGRVRNHKPCFVAVAAPEKKKSNFKVVLAVAPPPRAPQNLTSQQSVEDYIAEIRLQRAAEQEAEYARNAEYNDRISAELRKAHALKCMEEERQKAEQAAIDEEKAAVEKAQAAAKAAAEKRKQEEEERKDQPRQYAVRMVKKALAYKSNVQISYVDGNYNFKVLHPVQTDAPTQALSRTQEPEEEPDELRDTIWPLLHRLCTERRLVNDIINKLTKQKAQTKYGSAIAKRIHQREIQKDELNRKIQYAAQRQKELLWK